MTAIYWITVPISLPMIVKGASIPHPLQPGKPSHFGLTPAAEASMRVRAVITMLDKKYIIFMRD